MVDLRVTTPTGGDSVLNEATVEEFKKSLRGRLLLPSDSGYDQAREVWNGNIDRRPALIARCAGVADVIDSVNFARDHNLLVSVRGGGHNVAGLAVCNGGLMIDLSQMKSVLVDPVKHAARAEPGVTWGEFDHETQAFGLATTGGIVNDTGIAGLTLGGGLGWLAGKYGATCDNLLSADVVTADGKFLRASATENSDLYWGLRGGSGNFGVVTSFEYRLHSVGQMLAGLVLHPKDKASEVFRFYRDFLAKAPDELMAASAILTLPDGVPVAAIAVCYSGSIAEGERVIGPLRTFGPPIADTIGPVSYRQVQSMLDASVFPWGSQNYWKTGFINELSDEAIDTVVAHSQEIPSPRSIVLFFPVHGAAARTGRDETAFAHRQPSHQLGIYSLWLDPAESDTNIQWTREFWNAVRPFYSGGVYVNELSYDEVQDRIRDAYGKNYDRLVELKNKYDPTNLFRLNQNIQPTV